jgi:hypothetical protein
MKYRFADDTPGKQTLIHPKANGKVVKVRGSLPRAATSVRGAASTTVLGLSQDSIRVEGVTMTRNAATPVGGREAANGVRIVALKGGFNARVGTPW